MHIASFGDLHLGPTSVLNKFQIQEEDLLRFDDHLSCAHDRLILMGDIYQTDYGAIPGSSPKVLEMILKRYNRIVRRWRSPRYAGVFGNHDPVTQKKMEAGKQIHIVKDGWRLWFIHGHQFDPFVGENSHLPYYVTWMIGGLRRWRMKKTADFLEGPLYDFGQRLFRRLEKAACRALLYGKNHIIVMGHSHQMACRPFGQGVYCNSGAPHREFLPYVSIDTERRRIEIRAFLPPNNSTTLCFWQHPPISPGPV